ncbi:hypothetical protein UA08_02916 [Talaromyces atroroseus]|uniref:Fatty acid desaturase domain-containing protein n=1 Tax=Talaromyces atroroseus TaxID=1441469 RepID=A0A225B201_TALAT|nr:hypothetical protein UA08_02916 [Talaromyces atroroseus]OKL61999.1 hypothetical protein UA08_02916 [Talaromyces atroroseus]
MSLTQDGDLLCAELIRNEIPPSCFERSTTISLAYLARDCVYAASLVWLALKIDLIPSAPVRLLLWITYGFLQGCVGTGLWIVGHECGHGAFSDSPLLNDIVGWVVHSSLMVPYFSWKITHARHHRYTNNIEKDTAFVPETWKSAKIPETSSSTTASPMPLGGNLAAWGEMIHDTPIYTTFSLLRHQLLGWQAYLLFYVTAGSDSIPSSSGVATSKSSVQSHFDPFSALFRPSQRHLIVLSDLGLILVGTALYFLGQSLGGFKIMLLYVIPYLWVHHWLVAITYLHHTHLTVPHFADSSWSFVDGALSTVDRNFGFIGRHFFHNIIDYHVVHHLFPKIPFYKAEEATKAIIPILGARYNRDDRPFLRSLIETYTTCDYVYDTKLNGVFHWVRK